MQAKEGVIIFLVIVGQNQFQDNQRRVERARGEMHVTDQIYEKVEKSKILGADN